MGKLKGRCKIWSVGLGNKEFQFFLIATKFHASTQRPLQQLSSEKDVGNVMKYLKKSLEKVEDIPSTRKVLVTFEEITGYEFCYYMHILTTHISVMDQGNITVVTEFILTGLTYLSEFQLLLFLVILAIYLISLLGNLGLTVLITIDSLLHTPVYFFLGNLSALDLSYSSATAPKMLADFFLEVRTISLIECAIQIVCTQLILGSYLIGLLQGLIQPGVFQWNCHLSGNCSVICSAAGRRKAFCTCVSHIMVVGLLYGTAIFVYIQPSSHNVPENDEVVSVFYTLVIPMLNPLICSLRNKDVKDAPWKITHGKA
ncbi:olfactory receptor 493-like [Tachyglossus aculeatus]|uniref:olfactory receptor 493-like n=1 Tax=Tachyglossus aculeatus TaxID=9261 RepID=UPI0018F53115|nr:olfactory receptor 493-like [Tachyglossus aculeatus]